MVAQAVRVETFTEFVRTHELRLRESLMALLGGEAGRDAAAEALEYGWMHWDRVRKMENPVGYLFKVGRSRGRRVLVRKPVLFDQVDEVRTPDVEPKLPSALAALTERQRSVVVLVHCYGWSQSEAHIRVAVDIGGSTPQGHTGSPGPLIDRSHDGPIWSSLSL